MPKTFRENLREELDYQDMKVKELAVATGIPKPTLDCYLSARQVIPPADIAVKIAQALNVSVEYLVTGKDEKSKSPIFSQINPETKSILTDLDSIPQNIQKTIKNLKQEKKVKIISFIHDVEKLRGIFLNDDMQHEFDFMLNNADVFIVHNARMAAFFEEQGVKQEKIVILGIFDYLSHKVSDKSFENSINIAGNLDTQKSGYISKLKELSDVKIHLFGPNYIKNIDNDNIIYHGSFPMDLIANQLCGGFGLVWDGSELEACTGPNGNYLRYNNPHKLSLYLASGIPVFIWSGAAEAEFVKEHGVGVTISSLYDVPQILQNMTKERYNQYLMAVNEIAGQLREGKYTRQALEKSEKIILEEIDDGRL